MVIPHEMATPNATRERDSLSSQDDDKLFRKISGSDFVPKQIDCFFDALQGFFPQSDTLQDGDWGQSAVQMDGTEMVRVARVQVNAQNQPINGAAYWFDSVGLLRMAYLEPRIATYSDFVASDHKQIPRHIEVSQNGVPIIVVSIDLFEPSGPMPDSLFALDGVKPEILVDDDDSAPVFVEALPYFKVKPKIQQRDTAQ